MNPLGELEQVRCACMPGHYLSKLAHQPHLALHLCIRPLEKWSVRGEMQGDQLWSQPSLQAPPPNAVAVTQAWQVFIELAVSWAGAFLFILSS